jgi:hypothetical protein
MATMNLYIRKHTFSETFSSEYFFNFYALLEQDIPQSMVDKLIIFFEKTNNLRDTVKNNIHPSAGDTLRYFSSPDKNYGFTTIGLINHDDYTNIFLNFSARSESIQSLTDLYQELGWSVSDIKKASVSNLTFNEDTQKYEGLDLSFEEIENLYNSASSIND